MKTVLRIALAVAILAGGGAAYLGLKAKTETKAAKSAQADAEKQASDAASKLVGAEQKAKKASDDLQTTQAKLETTQKEAEANKQQAEDRTAQLKKTEGELAKVAADAKAASSKLAALESVLPKGVAPEQIVQEMKRVQQDLEALNEEKQVLSGKLADLEKENTTMKKRLENRVAGKIPKDLVGHVMAVNAEWNFVVLDVGENDGIVASQDMLIYRDGQLLGRIRITSVEPSISIGDILPKWTHGEVREGDTVIAAESTAS